MIEEEYEYNNPCSICGKDRIIRVNAEGYKKFDEDSVPLGEALPQITKKEVDVILCNVCNTCKPTITTHYV